MYESKNQSILSTGAFSVRLVKHTIGAIALLGGSLGIGMLGYRWFEQMPWLDGFLNAAMLLGGMGPVNPPQTEGGKLFAGLYALYAGLVFVAAVALVAAPMLHRFLHRFNLDEDDSPES